jgi:hypothetical protein
MLDIKTINKNKAYKNGPIVVTIDSFDVCNNLIMLNDFSNLLSTNKDSNKSPLDLDLFLDTFKEIDYEIDIFNPENNYDDFDWWAHQGMVTTYTD